MIDERTKLAARDIDIAALATRYGTELHRHGTNELAGACPCPGCTAQRDGFHVNVAMNRWRCYTCHPSAWFDAVELVKVCEGLNYPDAVQWLLGDSTPTPRIAKPVTPQPAKTWDTARATRFLADAQDRLWAAGSMGDRGRGYLEGRGLDGATWLNFGLGVANVKTGAGDYAPAIAIPWYVRGELASLAFRFLDAHDGQRYSRWGSAANRLFGNHANLDAAGTVVIVEGEFNAMAIWQIANHTRLHVLSTGKQADRLSDSAVRAIAQRYDTVIVWCDEQDASRALVGQLAPHVTGIVQSMYSPLHDGRKMDANARLQSGELGGELSAVREYMAHESGHVDRLYSDLMLGATSVQGLDAGSADVLKRLAERVGLALDVVLLENRHCVLG